MSNKHKSKALEDLLRELTKAGCRIERTNKSSIKIFAPNGRDMYTCHEGERAFHPVRRWANGVGLLA